LSAADRKLLVVAGPTASGKTALALRLADHFPLALISADSMQVYRGMDIGTAKPGPEERRRFALIDVADPGEGYSAGRFARDASAACEEAWKASQLPCLVGGSGLYLRALLQGLAEVPPIPAALRAEIAALEPAQALAELRRLDPETAGKIEIQNPRRVGRALEVIKATGKGLAAWQGESRPGLEYGALLGYCLDPGAEALAARIHRRNQAAFAMGWPDEAHALARHFGKEAVLSTGAIGYAELLSFSPEVAKPLIELRTRQYSRRQRTWFKKEPLLQAVADGVGIEHQVKAFIEGGT
jgi:tRNA dimethylallyltransferase